MQPAPIWQDFDRCGDVNLLYIINSDTQTQNQSGTGDINLAQNGCTVTYYEDIPDPNTGGTYHAVRTGTISNNIITFTGIAMVPVQGLTFSRNSIVCVGTISPDNSRIDANSTVDVAFSGPGISGSVTGGGTEVFIFNANPTAPTITTPSPLPAGWLGTDYNMALAATGGTMPYTWSIFSGSLPSGLNLSSDGVISGTPDTATNALFTVQVTGDDGLSSTKDFSLAIQQPTLTLHRLTVEALVADAPLDIDTPLAVEPITALLTNLPPLGLGLVADGVTPLLMELEAHPSTNTTYEIQLTPHGGSVDGLNDKLKVLSGGAFSTGSTLTLSPSTSQAFAYLEGLDREALTFDTGQTEISVDVTVSSGGLIVATNSFKLRRPPVVLVHGIGSTAAWEFSAPFLNELYQTYPTNFVIPVEYGVADGDDPIGNQKASLLRCAGLLQGRYLRQLRTPRCRFAQIGR